MRQLVRGRAYGHLSQRVQREHGCTLRAYILKRVNEDGLTHTKLADELGINRDRLYAYARANGIDLTTRPVAIDIWEEMVRRGTGTEG